MRNSKIARAFLHIHTGKPDSPVVDRVVNLNGSSVSLSWISPFYSCPLTYTLQVAELGGSVVLTNTTNATNFTVATLTKGSSYSFRVASVDEVGRMSNWSQSDVFSRGLSCACHCIFLGHLTLN